MAISPHSKHLLLAALLLLAAAQQVSMETSKSDSFDLKLVELQARLMNRWLLESPSPAPAPTLACGTTCMKCKCVPPGQSGNRELCGNCYTDMKTHKNQTKCP